MPVLNKVAAIELSSRTSASMTGSYQPINATGLDEPCFMIRIINASNQPVFISYDGVEDHDFVPANTTAQLEFQTNSQPSPYAALMPKGTIVYALGTAGTGTVYLSGYYQPQG